MKKHSGLKLALVLALTVTLCVAVMAVSVFADEVPVSDQTDFASAISGAPTDGSVRTVKITGSFTYDTAAYVDLPNNSNVVITSDDDYTITFDRTGSQYSFIRVTSGASLTLKGKVTLKGVLDNNRAIYLNGSGASFTLDENAVIDSFSMNSSNGGGAINMVAGTTVNIKGGTISNCKQTGTGHGGAINAPAGTTINISGGTISGCSTTGTSSGQGRGGAISQNSGSGGASNFTMMGGTITGNTSGTYGGGIALVGDTNNLNVSISGGTISGNTAGSYAGGISITGRSYFADPVTNLKVYGNKATSWAGGIYVYLLNNDYSLTLGAGTEIAGNVGQRGGGIFYERGGLTIDGATIGGSSVGTSTPDATGTRGNYSTSASYGGGGIRVDGDTVELIVNSGVFSYNKTAGYGGAIQLNKGAVTLNGGTFIGNVASASGNGIRVASGKTLTLSGNIETGSSDNFLSSGGTVQKGGAFTFTDPIKVDMSGKTEGAEILISGDSAVVESDAALFAVSTVFEGYRPSAGFDTDKLVLVLAVDENPDIIVKNITAGKDYLSLTTALGEAAADDVLELQDNVSINATVEPTVSITLTSAAGETFSVTRTSGSPMFRVKDGITLTLTGVKLDADGGNVNVVVVANGGTLVINDGTEITGATARAIANSGTVTMNGGKIYGNAGTSSGIALYNQNTFVMNGGEIYGNAGGNYGGAIYAYNSSGGVSTTINGGKIYNNTGRSGGAMYIETGDLTLGAVEIYGNQSTGSGYQGGAIAMMTEGGSLTANGANIHDNTSAGYGGAIATSDSKVIPVTLTNCVINDNTAVNGSGAGLYVSGALTLTGCTVTGNNAKNNGGGMLAKDALVLDNTTVSGNSATNKGGGMYAMSTLTVKNGTQMFNNTSLTNQGGAICVDGALEITDSTISGNKAKQSGGGIRANGTFEIENSEISQNTSETLGGGIYAAGEGSITGSTLDGNVSSSNGGAIYATKALTLDGVTMTGNVCAATYVDEVLTARVDSTGEPVTIKGSALFAEFVDALTLKDVTVTGNGNSTAAVYFSDSANTLILDGAVIIKDNAPSITNGNTKYGFAPDTDETAAGIYWWLGKAEKTTVKVKDTLNASSEIVFSLDLDKTKTGNTALIGKIFDADDNLSVADLSAAVANFTAPDGMEIIQDGSEITFKTLGTIEFTVISANNGESIVYTSDVVKGVDTFALPTQSSIVEAFTDGAAFEGSYEDKYFIGFAEVEGFDTPNATLKALYEDDNYKFTADELNGKTLYATWAYMNTMFGASVKLPANEVGYSGIRFVTLIETESLAKIGIKNLTKSEWENGDLGYRLGYTVTSDYGKDTASSQTYYGDGGLSYTEDWAGDAFYDEKFDDRGDNHAFSIGLMLTASQYEIEFTPSAFIAINYSQIAGEAHSETHKADVPKETDEVTQEEVTLARSARGVAQDFALFLADELENEDHYEEDYLGLTEGLMRALERVSGYTFDIDEKTFTEA